jgi:hypothetical protein
MAANSHGQNRGLTLIIPILFRRAPDSAEYQATEGRLLLEYETGSKIETQQIRIVNTKVNKKQSGSRILGTSLGFSVQASPQS